MNLFYKISWAFMKKNRRRTIVTMIGVILSAAMITAVTTMISTIQTSLVTYLEGTNGRWQARAEQVTDEDAGRILADERIQGGSTYKEIGYAEYEGSQNTMKPYLFLAGFESTAFDYLAVNLISGRLPSNSSELALSNDLYYNGYLEEAGLEIGGSITLSVGERISEEGESLWQMNAVVYGESTTGEERVEKKETLRNVEKRTYTLVGIFESPEYETYSSPGYTAITSKDSIRDAGKRNGLVFCMKKPVEISNFIDEMLPGYLVEENTGLLRFLGSVKNTAFYTVLFGLVGILAFLIGLGAFSLIYNAFSISVNERTKEFGILSSIGATKKQLRRGIWFEAVFISIVGIPAGIVSGIAGIFITLQFVGDGMLSIIQSGTQVILQVKPSGILLAAGFTLITVLISAWIPSIRAGKVSAMEAIRQSRDIRIRPREVKTGSFVNRIFGLEGVLADKSYKRNRRKYRSTVFSLAMSVTLFIGAFSFVGYLTGSIRPVFFNSTVDIQCELYNLKEGDLAETLYEKLKEEPHITKSALLNYIRVSAVVKEEEVNSSLAEKGYYSTMPDGTILLSTIIAILPDEQFRELAKSQNLNPEEYLGEEFCGIGDATIHFQDQDTNQYREESILSDEKGCALKLGDYTYIEKEPGVTVLEEREESPLYKKNLSLTIKAYISEEDSVFGYDRNYSVAVYVPESGYQKFMEGYRLEVLKRACFNSSSPRESYRTMRNILIEDGYYLSDYDGRSEMLMNMAAVSAKNRNAILAIKVLSAGFIALISLVAVVNVFHTISSNIQLRRHEFAMLKSVGMTDREFRRMINYECILIGLKSLFCGILAGFLFNGFIWYTIRCGVAIHVILPWRACAGAVLGVMVLVFASMQYASAKNRKSNIIDVLKEIES